MSDRQVAPSDGRSLEFVLRTVACEKCEGTGEEPLGPTIRTAIARVCPSCHEGRVPDPRDVEVMARAEYEFVHRGGSWDDLPEGVRESNREARRAGLLALMRNERTD